MKSETSFTVVLHFEVIEAFLLREAPTPKLMRLIADANATYRRRHEDRVVMLHPTDEDYVDLMEPLTNDEMEDVICGIVWGRTETYTDFDGTRRSDVLYPEVPNLRTMKFHPAWSNPIRPVAKALCPTWEGGPVC